MPSPNFTANGTIQPSRFVLVDPASTSGDQVIQASTATTELIGISQEFSKLAPIPNATSEAAAAGDLVKVYGLGEICLLQSTSAGWTANDRLCADADGKGIASTADAQFYGAIALTTISGAALGRVQVVLGQRGA